MYLAEVPSPVGNLLLLGGAEGRLHGLYLPDHLRSPVASPAWRRDDGRLRAAREQLEAYFAGERSVFSLERCASGSAFQERVWRALERIPYGTTVTYGELARRLGSPAAARAVGLANGRNPISIVVPCHRVVGAGGRLTGYGGGLEAKAWLLAHERAVLAKGAG